MTTATTTRQTFQRPLETQPGEHAIRNPADADARAHVVDAIGPAAFDRYFQGQALFAWEQRTLRITVRSGFLAQMLERRFGPQLRAARGPSAEPAPVDFIVDRDALEAVAPRTPTPPGTAAVRPPAPAPARPARRAAESLRYRLETFVVGEANKLAHAGALRVAEGDQRLTTLFIQGGCGLGKTHLLQGIAHRYQQLHAGSHVRYTTAEAFTNEFIAAIRAGKVEAFRRQCRRLDLLCIDDVHFLGGKDATQNELMHTFDAIGLEGARVVLASDEHPRDIKRLSQRLISRFVQGAVVKIEPPDADLRRRLVTHLASARGLALDEPAANLLAERSSRSMGSLGGFGGSVREIEGLLVQVEAVHRLLPELAPPHGGVGLALVRKALGLHDAEPGAETLRPRRPIPVSTIVAETCRALGVDVSDFLGRGRHKRVVFARSLVAHLSRRLTTQSYPEIARAMGRPNHSTVITAERRVVGQMKGAQPVEPELAPAYAGMTIREIADAVATAAVKAVS